MSAGDLMAEAKILMGKAVNPSSTREDRLAFYKQLIKLASYPSYQCRVYTGMFVAKFFAEFEDLQDEAVDAMLDLCEDDDEKVCLCFDPPDIKTRIVGIQGLAATGKADPRWVKGNTGVLLQLLGSQSAELKAVKNALSTLIRTLPEDVFDVMIENMSSSESDTGVSRAKIIDYLKESAPYALEYVLGKGAGPLPKPPGENTRVKEDKEVKEVAKPSIPVASTSSHKSHPLAPSHPTPTGPRAGTLPTGPKTEPKPSLRGPANNSIPTGPRRSIETSRPIETITSPPTASSSQLKLIPTPKSQSTPPVNSASKTNIPPIKIDSTPAKTVSPPTQTPSSPRPTPLASRLTESQNKRRREEEVTSTSSPPTLLSRLSAKSDPKVESRESRDLLSRLGQNDSRESKKPREESQTRSLLERMQPPSKASSPAQPEKSTTPEGGMQILNRSASSSNISTPQTLQIKSHATQISSPNSTPTFSIRSHAMTIDTSTTAPEDDGIIRKGRGFKKDLEGDDIMSTPLVHNSSPVPPWNGHSTTNHAGRGGYGTTRLHFGYAPGAVKR